jgi:hypothetical protein
VELYLSVFDKFHILCGQQDSYGTGFFPLLPHLKTQGWQAKYAKKQEGLINFV